MAGVGLKPAALTSSQRGSLFRALSRLEDAGLPADRAVAAMSDLLGPGHAQRFRAMSASIARGASLTEAGGRFGLWSARDRELIRLAEGSGALARAASMLADAYEYRARTFGKLRSRMILPLFVLALGLFLLPLPGLLNANIGAMDYLLRALGPLLLLVVAAGATLRILRRVAAEGIPQIAGRLALGLPLLGPAFSQLSRLELVEGLSLLLNAGVPAQQALESALKALTNSAASRIYLAALSKLQEEGLSAALKKVGAVDAEEYAIVSASEAAGRTVEGLERVAGMLRQVFQYRLDLVSEWLPRGVYLIVVAVIAGGLLG
ncbi:MAG: type II secretion system F family protein [Gammaproteobacteria bacterium]|nr:type II secretion system F family protein [Gammaproteobacteria bacterium]MDH3413209.1 type II secretion system F family protein [Gammaproteobacteria bacterium]